MTVEEVLDFIDTKISYCASIQAYDEALTLNKLHLEILNKWRQKTKKSYEEKMNYFKEIKNDQ